MRVVCFIALRSYFEDECRHVYQVLKVRNNELITSTELALRRDDVDESYDDRYKFNWPEKIALRYQATVCQQ